MDEQIKNRLIEVRNHYGESVYAFAKKLNIPQPNLHRYETEGNKIVNNLLLALINVCNVNINWLLTGKGEMFIFEPFTQRKERQRKRIQNFGQKIQKLRAENNLSVENFAKLTEIDEKDVIDYINNEKEPNLQDLIKITDNFNITIDELLF